jgi:histidinol-phosphate aminotransferase
MAAMRLGCLFSKAENVAWLKKAQSPYSVNTLAVLAARAAIRDTAYISEYVGEVLAAKELVYVGLEKLGINYVKSAGNFVLFDCGERAVEIRDALKVHDILVRDRSYEVRVTVGTREQMRKFLKELEAAWKNRG